MIKRKDMKTRCGAIFVALLAMPLSSCITVKAPDKPIEINLNVAITQEVLVRLQQDVQRLITSNPEAFPPAPTRP